MSNDTPKDAMKAEDKAEQFFKEKSFVSEHFEDQGESYIHVQDAREYARLYSHQLLTAEMPEVSVDSILQIIQDNYNKFTGTNEAELHAAEDIVDKILPYIQRLENERNVYRSNVQAERTLRAQDKEVYSEACANLQSENERMSKGIREIIEMGNRGKILTHIDSHISEYARKLLTHPK